MVVGQDTATKTIARGQEWHKDCYDKAFPAKGPSAGLAAQTSKCPGCQGQMVVGQDTATKTIARGQEWHKECYEIRRIRPRGRRRASRHADKQVPGLPGPDGGGPGHGHEDDRTRPGVAQGLLREGARMQSFHAPAHVAYETWPNGNCGMAGVSLEGSVGGSRGAGVPLPRLRRGHGGGPGLRHQDDRARPGVAQGVLREGAFPTKGPSAGLAAQTSKCPGCQGQMVVGQDTATKTIARGQEWHKECYEIAHPTKGPSAGLGAQTSKCPGCQGQMVVGQDTATKTIARGQEWHKDCYEKAYPSKGPSAGLAAQVCHCPGCGVGMVVGQDTATKTIARGQEWHKECYDKAIPTKGPSAGLAAQTSKCPGCQGLMVVGQDTAMKTIARGQEWHKDCYEKANPTQWSGGGPRGAGVPVPGLRSAAGGGRGPGPQDHREGPGVAHRVLPQVPGELQLVR